MSYLKNGDGPSDGAVARSAIAQAGGLCSVADLGRRWGISRQGARLVTRKPGFPEPILTEGCVELWLADEADAFRAAH